MHDSFEKEVQRKMEELGLTPSAPVWEKIESQIKPEKRKRRAIFWFFLACLLLAGGWWSYQSLNKNHQQASMEIEAPVEKNSPGKISISTGTRQQSDSSTGVVDSGINTEKIESQDRKPQSHSVNINSSNVIETKKRLENKTLEIVKPKTREEKFIQEQIVTSATAQEDQRSDLQITSVKPLNKETSSDKNTSSTSIIDSQVVAKEQVPVTIDSAVSPVINKEEIPLLKIDSSLKKKVAAAGKKWKKQITINVGHSSYASGLFFNTPARVNDAFQSSIGAPNFISYSPANISKGFAFAAGFLLTRQLSKKWEFAVGLQYSYYSTQTRIGDKKAIDTAVTFNMDKMAVEEFFTNTGNNNYTSRFHVAEIPVRFSYQPLQKLPLHISVGASYGRLLSTNALTYSRPSNLYYKNKENYNRDYMPITASVQYRFKSKKSFAIQTGPVIQYNVVKLQKENLSNIPHMFFAGLKTDIRF